METHYRIKNYAKRTFLAITNPHQTVIKTFPNSIDSISETSGYFLGTKNTRLISDNFIQNLEKLSYFHHTIDKASHSGRAIDIDLKNPITGRPMTGSSSGSALNVFFRINDLGVGTDGGGSVLAPAISLNLFGFIHPNLDKAPGISKELKTSTDGILFTPSIGLISRELYHIKNVVNEMVLKKSINTKLDFSVMVDDEINLNQLLDSRFHIHKINMKNKYSESRNFLIKYLNELLDKYDFVISKEGPVDLKGFGDTIYGHFDETTQKHQINANKGFIRVANMSGAVALTVPTDELSVGYVIITKNYDEKVRVLFDLADSMQSTPDNLIENYFGNLSKYFEMGV